MHGIFINYRREDVTGFARSVFDRLRSYFGDNQVFMDVSNIEPGLDFIDTINKGLKSCEALVVLIGPDWESICVERSGEPDDYVRIEVAAALKRKIRVIPVLVQGATMPAESNLPDDIKPLVRRQATALSNDRFDSDIERLIAVLEKTLGNKFKPKPTPNSAKKTWLGGRSGVLTGFLAAFVLLIFIGIWIEDENYEPDPILWEPGIYKDNALSAAESAKQSVAKTLNQAAPTVPNIVGTWYDNFGTAVLVQQQGNQFKAVIYDAYSGMLIYDSSGTINGNKLNYQWQTNQSSGTGVGTMQPDMRHIDIISTDNTTSMVETNQLHKEHLPGQ